MVDFNWEEHPHRRYNALSGDRVLVSPHRAKRPWQGKEEKRVEESLPHFDPECYLCPGNSRAGGVENPDYTDTFVFTNDFSALKPETPLDKYNHNDLLVAYGEPGICRVICFSPRHDLTLPEMEQSDVEQVVDLWVEEYTRLGNRSEINYVQIFENKGKMMGCSNPHPHGQIWAQQTIPDEPAKELVRQQEYFDKHNQCLLCDYLKIEQEQKSRIVLSNKSFTALVPFWAIWPFEIMILSSRHLDNFTELYDSEKRELADIIIRLTSKYDNLFQVSFPYSAGFHPAPTDGSDHPEWHFHMHFYPPLLRSATVKKFMVGYEMLGTPQRDITAESAAGRLRDLSDLHFSKM